MKHPPSSRYFRALITASAALCGAAVAHPGANARHSLTCRHFIKDAAAAATVISWNNPLYAAPSSGDDGPWDRVALDAAEAGLFGMDPDELAHVRIAAGTGAGKADLAKLRIKRITLGG